MRRRIAVSAAWSLTVAGAGLLALVGQSLGDPSAGAAFDLVFVGLAVDVVAFATVGAILVVRRPGNRVGLVLLAAAPLIVATFLGFAAGGLLTYAQGPEVLVAGWASLLGSVAIYPSLILAGPALALIFPDGHLPGPGWRWIVRAIVAGVAIGSLLSLGRPGPVNIGLADNPLGGMGLPWLDAAANLGVMAMAGSLVAAAAAVVVRLRRSRGTERQQLKWFVAANLVVAVCLILSIADGATDPTAFDILAVCSLSLPPIAIGMAVLRYRLYEIDRIISRTIGWAVVTGVLVTVFAVVVVTLQAILAGVTQRQTLAVAASTLAAFALFQPVRRRVQRAVDRRFDRARYDAQRTVDDFAQRLRDETDMEKVTGDLSGTAASTVAPISLSIWLRPRGAGR